MTRSIPILAAALLLLALALPAAAETAAFFPPRGSPAPAIELNDLNGAAFNTASLDGKTLVLLFAELGHEKLPRTLTDLKATLADARLSGQPIEPILIITKLPAGGQLNNPEPKLPRIILHDGEREVFGAYRILVLPSVVVVNAQRKVVHAMPAFSQQFQALLTDTLLCATGQLDDAQFEASLASNGKPQQSQAEVRAGRLIQMARQLARRGMFDAAEERYREAIQIHPASVDAQLGLADALIAQARLDDAEVELRRLLLARSECLDARLALVLVSIRRGGSHLDTADQTLKQLSTDNPNHPRIHYLSGLLHQERGATAEAAASYRRAAELLLDSHERP